MRIVKKIIAARGRGIDNIMAVGLFAALFLT